MSQNTKYNNVVHIKYREKENQWSIRRIYLSPSDTSEFTGSLFYQKHITKLKEIPNVFHSCSRCFPFAMKTIHDQTNPHLNGTWYCHKFDINKVTEMYNKFSDTLRIRDQKMLYQNGDLFLSKLGKKESDTKAVFADMDKVLETDDEAKEIYFLLRDLVPNTLIDEGKKVD
ncbi:hypothetical protein P7C71_g2738, partial [Lecanoromycetidae sp. Uapishka_2]